MNSLRTRFPLIVRAVMFVKGAYAGTVSTWVGGTSNAWTDASNWKRLFTPSRAIKNETSVE